MVRTLTKTEVTKALRTLDSAWELNMAATTLTRKCVFKNYIEGFMFVTRVVVHAEVMHHHPEVHLSYGRVKFILTTTEVKGLSAADIELAKKIDQLALLSTESRRA